MDSFFYMKYARPIQLPRNNPTSLDIYNAVVAAFSPDYQIEGWRLLFRQAIGTGSKGFLRLDTTNSKSLRLFDIQQ